MRNYQKSNVNNRRPGPTVDGRSQRWVSGVGPAPTSSPNAQRNYERYLALARAEAQSGNIVAAENYYQHAEQSAIPRAAVPCEPGFPAPHSPR
jgi:hypothetical protein